MNKKLKITLIVLVMILICLIGFGGIYIKNKAQFENILPDYELGANLEGIRETTFKVDDSTNEVIYDAEGKEVDSIPEGANEEEYKKENKPVNSEELKTVENYKTVKEIMIKRLKSLGISNYEVRLDEENGNIYVETTENKNTDTTLSELLVQGKFEISDTESGTVLMDRKDIDSVNVFYNNTQSGITTYLDIKFTKEGKAKLAQISKDYPKVEESQTENKEENSEEKNEENETESSEEDNKTKQKTITIKIDGQEFLSTYFDETIETGELTISIGKASKDTSTIAEYMTTAQYYATILDSGEMPLVYKTESSEYMQSIYSDNMYIYIALAILGTVALISIIYMIVRYKISGLICSIVYLATAGLLTILIRYTGVQISVETMVSATILIILLDYVYFKILKSINKNDTMEEKKASMNKALKKMIDVMIITLVPAVILTYSSLAKLSNIGMSLFWGIIVIGIMSLLATKVVLLVQTKKA